MNQSFPLSTNTRPPIKGRRWRILPGLLAVATAILPFTANADPRGEQIYTQLCASCHGKQGEGVADKHDEPLYGERSLEALTKYIDRTMPEDEPEKCSPEESKLVAAYIYDAFYSPTARARNHPPVKDLARLTNRQLQESLADLFAGFRPPSPPPAEPGLRGEYFASNGMNKKEKKGFDRVDQTLAFDFGKDSPGEGLPADQFSIAWQGSLITTETGVHEFRIFTPNGARLYVNAELREGDQNTRDDSDARRQIPLIDAWVSSGDTIREETGRVFLLGGRSYPLRVDYFKFKEKQASLRVEWKTPHGAWQVLSAPHCNTASAQRVLMVDVPLPPDDASHGYERGTSVSKEWVEATSKASMQAASHAMAHLRTFADAKSDAPDFEAKLRAFLDKLATRAFRRPLTTEQKDLYINRHFANGIAPEIATKRAIIAILQSPRFLYPDLTQERDAWETAARLALVLWDSLPDQTLAEAAAAGKLSTTEEITAQAERMLLDPRGRSKLGGFFDYWLAVEEAEDVSKDKETYPEFNEEILSDLRQSLAHFVDHVVWSDASNYRELLDADYLFLNKRLAKFYQMPEPEGAGFQRVKIDPAQRAGILTHPLLLTALSYHKSSSPIHRGVFLTRNVLGRFLKPPPMAIEFKDDRFDPSLTMREKVTELTNKSACMGCHVTINPLGFSLENFDAVGRWRTTDNQKPIDTATEYTTPDGEIIRLHGPRDLAKHAVASEEARRGFIRQLFQYLTKNPPVLYGPDTLAQLDESFSASQTNIRQLVVAIARTSATPLPPRSTTTQK